MAFSFRGKRRARSVLGRCARAGTDGGCGSFDDGLFEEWRHPHLMRKWGHHGEEIRIEAEHVAESPVHWQAKAVHKGIEDVGVGLERKPRAHDCRDDVFAHARAKVNV